MSHWADLLTENEVLATLKAADALRELPWAVPLLAVTRPFVEKLALGLHDRDAYVKSPISAAEKSFLFELRFAAALADKGMEAEYEHLAGVGGTAVDFAIQHEGRTWLVELVSLYESQAFKDSSWDDTKQAGAGEGTFGFALGLDPRKPKQSEEGELLKAQDRIGAKAFHSKAREPTKFPAPAGAVHMVLVDARGFLGSGKGDSADWRHIMYGAAGLAPELVRYWVDSKTGERAPIRGLFQDACPMSAAPTFQQRIHVVGFVCEKDFGPSEIGERTFLCWNPALPVPGADLDNPPLWPLGKPASSHVSEPT